jgi:hypothetical protein
MFDWIFLDVPFIWVGPKQSTCLHHRCNDEQFRVVLMHSMTIEGYSGYVKNVCAHLCEISPPPWIYHVYIYIWYDMIWYDMVWYDMIWHDMTWHDIWTVYHTTPDFLDFKGGSAGSCWANEHQRSNISCHLWLCSMANLRYRQDVKR